MAFYYAAFMKAIGSMAASTAEEKKTWINGRNGSYYHGDWSHGKRCGKGIRTYENGDVYDGDWLNDKFNGTGKYTYKKSGDVYTGQFVNGNRHGTFRVFIQQTGVVEEHYYQHDQIQKRTVKRDLR